MAMLVSSCSSKSALYPEAEREGSNLIIHVDALVPESPQFFTYRYRGKRINFFVVKMNDKVHSFFDACRICYYRKLGYRFESDRLICNACNVGYPLSEVERGFGSCFPIRLRGRLDGNNYIISTGDLEKMANKF